MSDRPLEVSGVFKTFRSFRRAEVRALSDFNCHVDAGRAVGLVGPNGAGKSTVIHSVLDLVRVDRGSIRLWGAPPQDRRVRRRIGYLPEVVQFCPHLRGDETLHLHGRLAGLETARLASRIDELADELGLRSFLTRKVFTYSKGMTQRLGLAQALVAMPELLLLDEPMVGLDPDSRATVHRILLREIARGVAVVISTHSLADVESICDEVAILGSGVLLYRSTIEDAYAVLGNSWQIELGEVGPEFAVPHHTVIVEPESRGGRLCLECTDVHKQTVLLELMTQGVSVHSVTRPRDMLARLYRSVSRGAHA